MTRSTHPVFGSRIPIGWTSRTVDEVKADEPSSCVAGPFGSSIGKKYFVDEGVPVIRGSNLTDDRTRFVPSGFVFVSEQRAKSFVPQHVVGGDLVFTCWGTIGQVGLIPTDGPYPAYVISNKQLKLRPNREIADPLFLFYYFASDQMVQYIRNRAIGAAVPGINLGILKNLPVVLPPIDVQHRIRTVLGAYDELIENNLRRIEILEEMAQALYREWFVEFRFPGHEDVEMVDSELGPIPQGWCWDSFMTLADEIKEGVSPEDVDPNTPYVGLEHIPRRSFTITETGVASEVGSRKWRFEPGDVLFGKLRPYFHKVALASDGGISSTDVIVIRPRAHRHEIALQVAFSEDFVGHAVATSGGTDRPRAKWSDLAEFAVAIPPDPLLRRFRETVRPMLRLTQNLAHQNANLRTARDLLLPKLVSGEIDVSDLDIDTDWLVA